MNRVHLSTQLNDKGNEGEFQFSSIALPQDISSILLEFISGNFHEYFVKFVKIHMSQLTPVIVPRSTISCDIVELRDNLQRTGQLGHVFFYELHKIFMKIA